jgi:two-component system, OmpR family, response regulator
MRILLIEDDPETSAYIREGLTSAGHAVALAARGDTGLQLAATGSFDVLIIDRMLPRMDGLTLIKALRVAAIETPVLCLTALGGVEDRVNGLEAGADDYLAKPFEFTELLARINALTRRSGRAAKETKMRVADLELDQITRKVTRGGKGIDLLPREFALLELLMQNAGKIVTRAMLLKHVWDFHFEPKTSLVETHMSRLRTKIDRPFEVSLLHTVRGRGYRLDEAS